MEKKPTATLKFCGFIKTIFVQKKIKKKLFIWGISSYASFIFLIDVTLTFLHSV